MEYDLLYIMEYYKKYGQTEGKNYILLSQIRKELSKPVFDGYNKYSIEFCPCCYNDVFSEDKL